MARKTKKKVVKKKVVSQKPRKAHSRPVWALLLFTIAALIAVSIFDYEKDQTHLAADSVSTNLVGDFGSNIGHLAFRSLGVASFLLPLFIFWQGVRLLVQQDLGKRLLVGIVSPLAIVCGAALSANITNEGSIFERQLTSDTFGGFIGEFVVTHMHFFGPFGTIFIPLMGLLIGVVIIFTDNPGRFFNYIQNACRNFLASRAGSKGERKARKAKLAAAKLVAKEEAARAKSQAKLERAAAKKDKSEKSAQKVAEELTEDAEEDEALEDDRKPSLLRGAPTALPVTSGSVASKTPPKKKIISKPQVPEPEPKKPALDPATIKIISGEKTEKSVANIPERRGDYIFPPRGLLSEAPTGSMPPPKIMLAR